MKKLRKKKTVSSNVIVSTTKTDLPTVSRPDFADTLVFPNDVTQLDPAGLTRLMGRYELLRAYVTFDYAKTKQKEVELNVKLREEVSRCTMGETLNVRTPKYAIDRKVENSPEVRKVKDDLMRVQVVKVNQEAYLEVYERFVNVLSRELTRQKGGM